MSKQYIPRGSLASKLRVGDRVLWRGIEPGTVLAFVDKSSVRIQWDDGKRGDFYLPNFCIYPITLV